MNENDVQDFVTSWLRGWNAEELDLVLWHFADAVVFTSPMATRLLEQCGGVIRGKAVLREYWAAGVQRIPDLRFDVVGTYAGVDTVVINYRDQNGGLVSEVLMFDGPLVV
jgi:SnoaL-like protein